MTTSATAPDHDHGDADDTDEVATLRSAVATNMRRARLARGMSLRDMSAQTGLSTALLSQIEREVANPTVSTLARVGQALDLSFAELTRSEVGEPEVIRRSATTSKGPRARMLFSMMERRRFDISEGVLPPHTAGVASDHGRGSIEHGYVVAGRVTLIVGNDSIALEEGDAVRFASAIPHAYSTDEVAATLLTVVVYNDE
jgi:transcriptional regulator with XRE-family HTH domain